MKTNLREIRLENAVCISLPQDKMEWCNFANALTDDHVA
jgi:hypothetical protein